MNPFGGIQSETDEVLGIPPPFAPLRGDRSRTPLRDFFSPVFFFGVAFFFCLGLSIMGVEFAWQLERRQEPVLCFSTSGPAVLSNI